MCPVHVLLYEILLQHTKNIFQTIFFQKQDHARVSYRGQMKKACCNALKKEALKHAKEGGGPGLFDLPVDQM